MPAPNNSERTLVRNRRDRTSFERIPRLITHCLKLSRDLRIGCKPLQSLFFQKKMKSLDKQRYWNKLTLKCHLYYSNPKSNQCLVDFDPTQVPKNKIPNSTKTINKLN